MKPKFKRRKDCWLCVFSTFLRVDDKGHCKEHDYDFEYENQVFDVYCPDFKRDTRADEIAEGI